MFHSPGREQCRFAWRMTEARLFSGWDVGGAHLKMAAVNAAGRLQAAGQWSTPLWRGLDCLAAAVEAACGALPAREPGHIAVTMTGELVDYFSDRGEGVAAISHCLSEVFAGREISFYGGQQGFLRGALRSDRYAAIASANWYATGSYIATRMQRGILVDVGSTTTDIMPFADGRLLTAARSDHERLLRQELCYTGVVRTPVMAVTDRLPWQGDWCPVMNELFANMADVYRVTGELPAGADMHETCDGRDKTPGASFRRLARMIGIDADRTADPQTWHAAAVHVGERQREQLQGIVEKVLQDHGWGAAGQADIQLVGAGCGRFLVRSMANALQLEYVDFDSVLESPPEHKNTAADCATAVALAQLLRLSTCNKN